MMRRKWPLIVAIVAAMVIALPMAGAWWLVRDEVAIVRSWEAVAPQVPARVKAAFVAMEGPLRTSKPRWSLIRAIRHRNDVGCGPTLAWRLAKYTVPRSRMARWHLEAALVTQALAREFTDEELLRVYAHRVYLGRRMDGIEQASRAYFARPASSLTIAEAAMLVGITLQPHYYSPVQHPDRARKVRDRVLKRMRETGSLTESQYRESLREALHVNPALRVLQQASQ